MSFPLKISKFPGWDGPCDCPKCGSEKAYSIGGPNEDGTQCKSVLWCFSCNYRRETIGNEVIESETIK